ncbi:NAD(P)-dependent oxidoreductase [Psychromarinibacter sp. C21-152]|uniref:NAD(P)-dependent oxidoreductase n=1 Tax=Psychromarinibacter sediminicola TaxID=3033385 RepID=A0AAE3T932_9RHOB|nr:NAD(P)-dependent oxidoreductase [Psychromarinibacter sediminicola]MDF0602075.1 NAD(P)-dependent oxidoreductase [Psychromarinibacter sediminicola]
MTTSDGKQAIGFIGLGIMGALMAGHILEAGHQLHLYNRTRAKADDLVAHGATWHDNPGRVAEHCDIVFTMLGYPPDVEAVFLGPDGLVARARPGTVLVDMTTSSPDLARRIAEAAAARDLGALDAPVSGGDVGARAGRLAIMAGGEQTTFEKVRPFFELMGETIAHLGPAGAGQHAKLANQIAIASTMMAVSESIAYAEAAGLDPRQVLDVIGTGAASSFLLVNLGPKMVARDYSAGFFVHHFVKDMEIALDEAARMGLDLPGLHLARKLYRRLTEAGHAEDGTQGIFRLFAETGHTQNRA